MTAPFQRARHPEQLAARRSAILAAARAALADKPVGDITLTDISERVGLAKSNVLRYFDSREAILLEVLDEEFGRWLTDVEQELGASTQQSPGYAAEIGVAGTLAESLARQQVLCDLLGAMAGVLERNITLDTARSFKARSSEKLSTLGAILERQLPWIGAESAAFVAEAAMGFAAGTYPFSLPTPPVRQAITELGLPEPRRRFTDGLRYALTLWLIGAGANPHQ